MKKHASLEELLEEYTEHAVFWVCNKEEGDVKKVVADFLSDNSLALGKPEPLEKKQADRE